MRRTAAAIATAALLLAGCGDDDAETSTEETTTTEDAAADPTTSTTEAGSTSTTASTGADELPGERLDIYPYADAPLAVVGVAADDVLNVRAAPDPSAHVVTELAPLADGFTATGHNRQLDGGQLWAEVDTAEGRGWVSVAYVAQVGATDDAPARLYPAPADRPLAGTLLELARTVAADVVGEQTEPEPRVVVVDGPDVGDLGEVTVDVLGYPDDAVLGERLRIFAEAEGGESFRLRTVEATTLCRRGVSDGLCV